MFLLTYSGENLNTLRGHVYTHIFSKERIEELKQLVGEYKREIGEFYPEDEEISEIGAIEEGNYIYSYDGDSAEYMIRVQYAEDGASHEVDFEF